MLKRKIIISAAVAICLCAAFGIGGYLTNSSDAAESKQLQTEAVRTSGNVLEKRSDDRKSKEADLKSADKMSKTVDNIKPETTKKEAHTSGVTHRSQRPLDTSSKANVSQSSNKDKKPETKEKSKEKTKEKDKPKEASKEPKHTHDWEAVYSYETVEDISSKLVDICHGCGADMTNWSSDKRHSHADAHMDKGEPSGFYEKEVKYVSGTHKIKHLVGYKCSCGATK